jgi:hypothetical protein
VIMVNTLKVFLCLLQVALLTTLAVGRPVSQSDEVETLIKAVKILEQDPLGKDAKDIRSKALIWVIQTDKVSVSVCSLLLSGPHKKYKYNSELYGQYTIAMAAFKLANPEKAADENAVQQAGIESALVSYEAIVREKPKGTDSFMDSLLAKRSDGSLAKYVLENNCRDKK